jgi:hypothetical protein
MSEQELRDLFASPVKADHQLKQSMKKMIHSKVHRRAFLQSTAAAALGATMTLPSDAADAPRVNSGRRIGFVDLNLDNYHANVFLQALRGPLAARGFTVAGATGAKTAESRAWAEKNQVPFFDNDASLDGAGLLHGARAVESGSSPRALPANPPFRKPTYVDKTFATDYATAQKIFALADEHGTPVQTTSALRYTNVQDEMRKAAPAKVEHMITWGGGGSFDEYAIHPLELLISVMGHEATGLMRRGTAERAQLLIEFTGRRTGVVNVFPRTNTPFAASFTTDKASRYVEVDASKIFVNNQAAILDFFASGKPNVDRRESLTLMRLLDTARDPRALNGFVALG